MHRQGGREWTFRSTAQLSVRCPGSAPSANRPSASACGSGSAPARNLIQHRSARCRGRFDPTRHCTAFSDRRALSSAEREPPARGRTPAGQRPQLAFDEDPRRQGRQVRQEPTREDSRRRPAGQTGGWVRGGNPRWRSERPRWPCLR